MRILLTGFSLSTRAGHDSATRQLARALQTRGHIIMASGSHPAQLPRTIEIDWIPVASDPGNLTEPPDIIHACHLHDAFWALAALPGVPAVLQLDDPSSMVPRHPRIYRHLHRASSGGNAPDRGMDGVGSFNPDPVMSLPEDEEWLGPALEKIYTRVIGEHGQRRTDAAAENTANLNYLKDLFPQLMRVPGLNPLSLTGG